MRRERQWHRFQFSGVGKRRMPPTRSPVLCELSAFAFFPAFLDSRCLRHPILRRALKDVSCGDMLYTPRKQGGSTFSPAGNVFTGLISRELYGAREAARPHTARFAWPSMLSFSALRS